MKRLANKSQVGANEPQSRISWWTKVHHSCTVWVQVNVGRTTNDLQFYIVLLGFYLLAYV